MQKVSIVVPTKNCEKTIRALLESFFKVDYPSFEVIIADSSTDGTADIAERYGAKVVHVSRTGYCAAVNDGISSSTAEIICLTDGDCEVSTNWIQQILAAFEEDPKIGAVGGRVFLNARDSSNFWELYAEEAVNPIFPRYQEKSTLELNKFFKQERAKYVRSPVGCNLAIRRKVWREVGGFNEGWKVGWDESEFLYRVLRSGYCIKIDPDIIVYHNHRSSLIDLLRQVNSYGRGFARFAKTYKPSLFKNKISQTLGDLIETFPHCLRLCREKRELSPLLYPLVDCLVGLAYYAGIIKEMLLNKIYPHKYLDVGIPEDYKKANQRLLGAGLEASDFTITVIIPALDEEKGIGLTLLELREVLEDPHYLVVDGNSMDRTAEIARSMKAEVVTQEGRGKGRAVAQALEHINWDTRYVVFIDADFTYTAEYIRKMIEILDDNPDVAMVSGNRFNERFELKSMGNAYYIGNRFLAWMQHWLNGIELRDPLTGLRVVRWDVLRGWRPKSKGFDVEAELNHHVKRMGYRMVEVPINYRERKGEKKLKLRHGFTILKRILIQSLDRL